eukprot:77102_1
MSYNVNVFRRMDALIREYYQRSGIDSYVNEDSENGRFLQYIFDEELDDSDISIDDELGENTQASDCIYVDFDINEFPMNTVTDIDGNNVKQKVIFFILRHCYKFNSVPSDQKIQQYIIANNENNAIFEEPKCFCGSTLILSNVTELYGTAHVYCDQCDTLQNGSVWHCPMGQIDSHSDGFDVCNNCFHECTKKMNDYRTKIKQFMNSVHSPQNVICICGGNLTKNCAAFENRYCDICGTKSEDGIIFWSCSNDIGWHRSDGIEKFDVCNECYCTGLKVYTNDMNEEECRIVSECVSLPLFLQKMKEYQNIGDAALNIDKQKMIDFMNHFLHLMHNHSDDRQFELIVTKLGLCNVAECDIFRRNYRDRIETVTEITETVNTNTITVFCKIYQSIMDKMHCYFQHCYDIGNRLTVNEREFINDVSCDQKQSENVDNNDEYFTNKKLMKMNEIIGSKREVYQKRFSFHNQSYDKWYQIHSTEQYSFGFAFKYGYEDEIIDLHKKSIIVSPKYSSLKKELISNKIAILTLEVFNIEYGKAQIHFESKYCKQQFRPFIWYTDGDRFREIPRNIFRIAPCLNGKNRIIGDIDFQCILTLMIYCNISHLQSELSKTYRNDGGMRHNEFYWFGKYLKISVHKFGTEIKNGVNTKFFHGISEKLFFPQYINTASNVFIQPQCPLSTSSSFEVAANFTNHNNGLVVQLCSKFSKYFSVAWLSDFANEKEYFFVQTVGMLGMNIENIIDVQRGWKYNSILDALMIINKIVGDKNKKNMIVDHLLIYKLISHQISRTLSDYESFKSLSEYGKHICQTFFNKTWYTIIWDWKQLKKHYQSLFRLLCYEKSESFKINAICAVFPNMKHLRLKNLNLCSLLLNDILSVIQSGKVQSLETVTITIIDPSVLSFTEALTKYTKLYKDSKFDIYTLYCPIVEETRLNITKYINESQLIIQFFLEMGKMEYKFKPNLIEQLLHESLQPNVNKDSYEQFHKWRRNYTSIAIDWKYIVSNSNFKIFQRFYHSTYQWIDLTFVRKFLPKIEEITVWDIRLCERTLEDIYSVLAQGTTIEHISIRLGHGKSNAYKHRGNMYNFPNSVQELQIRKKLMNYLKDDNIYENDWKSFESLYSIRCNIQVSNIDHGQRTENMYHLDSLITSFASFKYKHLFQKEKYRIYVDLVEEADELRIDKILS